MQAIDYSARIPGSTVRLAGYLHVFRYLGDPQAWTKAMTQDEVNDLRNHGIFIHLNYEQTADFMLGGYSAGQSFAKEARKWATSLGFGTHEPIVYSADFDASDAQIAILLEFLHGAADADGGKSNVGIYGGYKVVKAAIDQGYIGWQTYAWSYGQIDTRAVAYQHGTIYVGGVQCDVNDMNPYYLQGVHNMTNPIPASIGQKWAEIASQFTGSYDDSTAIIWADAGARYAAARTDDIMNFLETHGAPSAGVSLTAGDIDAIATAVVKKMSRDLAAG